MDWVALASKYYIELDKAGVTEGAQTFLTRALAYMADNESSGFLSIEDAKKLGLKRLPGRINQLVQEEVMVPVFLDENGERRRHPCSISVLSLSSSLSYNRSHLGWDFPKWLKWQEPMERQIRKRKADRERVAQRRAEAENVARQSQNVASAQLPIPKEPTYVGRAVTESNASATENAAPEIHPEPFNERPTGPPVDPTGWALVRRVIPDAHPQSVRTALAMHCGSMLKKGQPEQDVIDALALWLTKPNLGPGVLPSLVSEVIKSRTAASSFGSGTAGIGKATEKARGWHQIGQQLAQAQQESLDSTQKEITQ